MPKLRGSTILFLGLLCAGLAILVSQLWKVSQYNNNNQIVAKNILVSKNGSSLDLNGQTVEVALHSSQLSTPVLVDFSILQGLQTSPQTKQFLLSLYDLGNLGKRDKFQKSLKTLEAQRILANLMLRENELEHLDTVKLNVSMLSSEQLQNAKHLAHQLLLGLKKIQRDGSCSKEQLSVINLSMARIIYLSKGLEGELNQFSINDPLLLQETMRLSQVNIINMRNKEGEAVKVKEVALSSKELKMSDLKQTADLSKVKSREDFQYDLSITPPN